MVFLLVSLAWLLPLLIVQYEQECYPLPLAPTPPSASSNSFFYRPGASMTAVDAEITELHMDNVYSHLTIFHDAGSSEREATVRMAKWCLGVPVISAWDSCGPGNYCIKKLSPRLIRTQGSYEIWSESSSRGQNPSAQSVFNVLVQHTPSKKVRAVLHAKELDGSPSALVYPRHCSFCPLVASRIQPLSSRGTFTTWAQAKIESNFASRRRALLSDGIHEVLENWQGFRNDIAV